MDFEDEQRPPQAYVSGPAKISVAENGPARVAVQVERDAEGSQFCADPFVYPPAMQVIGLSLPTRSIGKRKARI